MPSSLFEIEPFSELTLYQALSNDQLSAESVAQNRIAKYLVGHLNEMGAGSIVIEWDYIDGDYLDDFASYYVRCYTTYSRICKRLHFFTLDPIATNKALEDALSSIKDSDEMIALNSAYLGFVVARPLPEAIIGRTVLKTYPDDGDRRHYTCIREYRAHPFGLDLGVDSLPFQEQDTVLAACATVALWSCLHKASLLFGTPAPRPAAITQAATQFFLSSRPIPSHGLNTYQLSSAITRVGLEAEVIDVKPATPLVSLLYSYLEMGIPLLLGVRMETGNHAIAVTGYSLKHDAPLAKEVAPSERSIAMTGSKIDEFYVHDDQIGPFARLKVTPSGDFKGATYPVTFQGSGEVCWKDPKSGKPLTMYPYMVLIPIYNKIRITFLDLQRWMARLDRVVGWLVAATVPKPTFEWNIFLTDTNAFKKSIKTNPKISRARLAELLIEQQPRYLWRVILRIGTAVVAEWLADATGMARAMPFRTAIWFDEGFRATFSQILTNPTTKDFAARTLTDPFFKFLVSVSNGNPQP